MERWVDNKIPGTEAPLVSIGIDLIRVIELVRDHVVQFAAFKFNLFLIVLILHNVGASLASCAGSIFVLWRFAFFLIIYLRSRYRNALATIGLKVLLIDILRVTIVIALVLLLPVP